MARRLTQGRWLAALLALFLAAGALKASPVFAPLPIDLTLLCAVLIVLAAVNVVFGDLIRREPLGRVIWLLAAAAIAGATTLHSVDTKYAHDKVLALLTLTLGCAFGGALLLVRTYEQRRWLVWATVALGCLVVGLYRVAPDTSSALLGRAALEGSNTIAPGRLAGAGLVALITLVIGRQIRWFPALVLGAALAGLMVSTGSRGPLVAAGVSLLTLVPLLATGRHRKRTLVVVTAAVLLGAFYISRSSLVVQDRLYDLVGNNKGQSVYQREYMWGRAWDSFQQHPLTGLGWGGLSTQLAPVDRYPHNIVLEVAGEAGLVGLLALLAVLVVAYFRAFQHARGGDATALSLVALLTFWLVNALVSGDINDNRGVFVFAAACIAMGRIRSGRAEALVVDKVVVTRGVPPREASSLGRSPAR